MFGTHQLHIKNVLVANFHLFFPDVARFIQSFSPNSYKDESLNITVHNACIENLRTSTYL